MEMLARSVLGLEALTLPHPPGVHLCPMAQIKTGRGDVSHTLASLASPHHLHSPDTHLNTSLPSAVGMRCHQDRANTFCFGPCYFHSYLLLSCYMCQPQTYC